ncbi:MAG: DNA primase [Niallia sp.]
MSEFQEIKERIHREEKIEQLLIKLDCWGIEDEQGGNLIVAGLPDGDNPRSVQIKNKPSLDAAIRSKGITGSIFDIVSYIKYDGDTEEKRKALLGKSKYWICNTLGYVEYIDEFYRVTSDKQEENVNYNSWLKKVKRNPIKEIETNKVISTDYRNHFGVIPYKKWYDEGLSIITQRKFEVSIDVPSERVVFPIHNKFGELIGYKGRYCGKVKEIEDRYKYLYVVPCNKSIEFFNLHRALPYINEKREVIVVEGAKTVMFLDQWGCKNAISIEGDILTDGQLVLLKELGIDIKFVFVWDKDKDTKFIYHEVNKLKGRLKYAVLDTEDLLQEKDSPTDRGKKVWNTLYINHQYKVN